MSRVVYCILFAFFFSLSCRGQSRQPVPDPLGRVSDFATVFTPAQVSRMDSLIADHEKKTTNQLAVVALLSDSTAIPSMELFETFCLELFNKWGIGQKGKDNGVAIIFSPVLRYVRIQVGDGLRSRLTDAEAKEIIDTIIIPRFKEQPYFEGTARALEAVFSQIPE